MTDKQLDHVTGGAQNAAADGGKNTAAGGVRNFIKIAGFLAGLIAILAVLSMFFGGGYWAQKGYVADRDARIALVTTEEPGTIDVLNVGDSVCNISLTPMELFQDYGYTSYNIGRDLQKAMESYFYIRTTLKKQPV